MKPGSSFARANRRGISSATWAMDGHEDKDSKNKGQGALLLTEGRLRCTLIMLCGLWLGLDNLEECRQAINNGSPSPSRAQQEAHVCRC